MGGQTTGGIASGNILNIKGGTIGTTIAADEEENPLMSGNLIAAGVNEEGPATDNTVNITGGLLGSMMSLYGGYSTIPDWRHRVKQHPEYFWRYHQQGQ